jgi:hypothetical protein
MSLQSIFLKIISADKNLNCLRNVTDPIFFDLIYNQLHIKSQDFLVVLEELLMNSKEHGRVDADLYYGSLEDKIWFAITDKGSGIHSTIPLNQRLSDLSGKTSSSILRLSLEEGITGTGKLGRGMGLYYFNKFIVDHEGEGIISSNSGLVHQKSDQFFEKTLSQDTGSNVILLMVPKIKVGL